MGNNTPELRCTVIFLVLLCVMHIVVMYFVNVTSMLASSHPRQTQLKQNGNWITVPYMMKTWIELCQIRSVHHMYINLISDS
jgi:hypothetical protein